MALNDFLLEILVCPSTKQGLVPASPDLVLRVNENIEGGELRDVGGEVVAEKVGALLVREDGGIAYPVRDDIPEMLVERGISVDDSQ